MDIDVTEAGDGPRRPVRTAVDRASSSLGGRTSFVEPALLAALALRPSHGYGLKRMVEEMTEGLVSVDLPATYRLLRRLEAEGLTDSTWTPGDSGPQRREYALTSAGWDLLADWRRFLTRQRRVSELTTGVIDAALSVEHGPDGSAEAHAITPVDSGDVA